MHENQLGDLIIGRCIHLHQSIGPGMLESVYEELLAYELGKLKLTVERQKIHDLVYEDCIIPNAFRTDLIVGNKVLLELKSSEVMHPVYFKQVLTYLRITKLKLGYVLNFGQKMMTDGVQRVVNNI